MKMLLVARKSLLEIGREAQLLALTLLMPVLFIGITAVSYTYPLLATYSILVVDPAEQGQALIDRLRAQRYSDGRPTFAINLTTGPAAVDTALKDQSAVAAVIISPQAGESSPAVTIRGDALNLRFYRASVVLERLITRHADEMAGRPEAVRLVVQSLAVHSPQTEFDVYTPGIIIFALLLLIPQTATLVAREIRWRTLRRLRLTPMRAWDLLAGVGLAQLVVAVAQVVLIFVAAVAMGFHNQGSLGLAILVGVVISFSAIGLGLLTACFVENDSQALNIGSVVTMTQVFLSGSFYQLPPITMFTLAGHQIDLFDIFPATHGFLALQQVLTYGAGLPEIGFRLATAVVLSGVYLAVGVIIFQYLQMKEKRA
jgi:ABC-2 type transport system permease protein